ncbi:MAG: MFS transporter [Rickettsiales bacterium]|nr:MFS transporter [Rickettsiales bacterium]
MESNKETIADELYEILTEDGEQRVCKDISEASCNETPGNYFLNAFNGFSSKLAEQLASPTLVIPWVFSLLGVPSFFSGLLVPVKNAGSLVPQLFVSGKIRRFSKRKYFWSGAALVQAIAMMSIALTIHLENTSLFGWIVVGALTLFSIASGVASIAFKDVMGKTIPKGKRGQLLALRATGGGVLTTITGIVFYFFLTNTKDEEAYVWIFSIAAVLWLVASILFGLIHEEAGATDGGRTPVQELKNGLNILKNDNNYRRFLITRGLLLAIPLVQPFFILYAQENIGVDIKGLGLFVILTGVSNMISSPFWGKFADKSSKKLMIVTGVMAALVCGYSLLFEMFPKDWQNIYTYSPVFILIIISYGGARMARKAYLVDYAPKDERPLYVSMANTSIGILILLSGMLSLIVNYFGIEIMVSFLAITMLLAALSAARLKDI